VLLNFLCNLIVSFYILKYEKKKMETLYHYFKKITAKKIIFIFNLMRLI
jgi:hypothetical protein